MTANAKEALAGASDYEQRTQNLLQSAENTLKVDKLINVFVLHINKLAGFKYTSSLRLILNNFLKLSSFNISLKTSSLS